MKNLLKIKSIVTIIVMVTFAIAVLAQLEMNDAMFGVFAGAVGAVIGSLFAKKDNTQE